MRARHNDPGTMADTTVSMPGGCTPLQTHQSKVSTRKARRQATTNRAKIRDNSRRTAQHIYHYIQIRGGIFLSMIPHTKNVCSQLGTHCETQLPTPQTLQMASAASFLEGSQTFCLPPEQVMTWKMICIMSIQSPFKY